MPEYCFYCDRCGESKSKVARIGKAPKSVRCYCGGRMRRDYRKEHRDMEVADYTGGKVWYDIATHPMDVENDRKVFKRAGIGAEVRPDGGIVCHSDKQRQQVLKLLGIGQ